MLILTVCFLYGMVFKHSRDVTSLLWCNVVTLVTTISITISIVSKLKIHTQQTFIWSKH